MKRKSLKHFIKNWEKVDKSNIFNLILVDKGTLLFSLCSSTIMDEIYELKVLTT